MKARVYDDVVLTVDVPGSFGDRIIPKGTRGWSSRPVTNQQSDTPSS